MLFKKTKRMESLLICDGCKSKFDLEKRLPKILPCSCMLCLICLDERKNEFDEYIFKCNSCQKSHHFSDLDSILTSQIVSHILENTNENENRLLEKFSEKLAQKINFQTNETSKHYESVLCDIQNRSERLIEVSNFE